METPTVTLTVPATTRLRERLTAQRPLPAGAGLRVAVVHGGCSGFRYQLALDVEADGDEVLVQEGMRILVDAESAPYVCGSRIDVVDGPGESGFVVHNPNVIAGCGCGSSFVLREDAQ